MHEVWAQSPISSAASEPDSPNFRQVLEGGRWHVDGVVESDHMWLTVDPQHWGGDVLSEVTLQHIHIIYPHFLLWCPNTAWTEETDDRKIIWLVQCWSTRANSGITKASEADFCQLAIVDVVFISRPSSWILPALAGLKNMDVVFNANILNEIWLPTVTTCCCVFSTSHIWAHSKCKPGWLSELCEHKVKKGGWDRQRKSYMQSIQKCPLNVHTRGYVYFQTCSFPSSQKAFYSLFLTSSVFCPICQNDMKTQTHFLLFLLHQF